MVSACVVLHTDKVASSYGRSEHSDKLTKVWKRINTGGWLSNLPQVIKEVSSYSIPTGRPTAKPCVTHLTAAVYPSAWLCLSGFLIPGKRHQLTFCNGKDLQLINIYNCSLDGLIPFYLWLSLT